MKTKTFFLAFLALIMALNGLGMSAFGVRAAETTLSKDLDFGKEYDLVLNGKVGMYTPTSGLDGIFTMDLITPDTTKPFKDTTMTFSGDWVDLNFTASGKSVDIVYGLMYLYWNLDEASRKLYNEGRLGIYRYMGDDDTTKNWEVCDAQIFFENENKPYGRLACAITKFDLYTLAVAPSGRSALVDGAKLSQRIVYGKEYDLWVGSTGVYTPKSAFTGRLEMIETLPNGTKPFSGMTFQGSWNDLRIYNNSTGKVFKRAYGLIYVYFNLTPDQRALYDKGKLSIYYYNEGAAKWEACDVVVFLKGENKPNGRLSCVIEDFGLYTLAAKP